MSSTSSSQSTSARSVLDGADSPAATERNCGHRHSDQPRHLVQVDRPPPPAVARRVRRAQLNRQSARAIGAGVELNLVGRGQRTSLERNRQRAVGRARLSSRTECDRDPDGQQLPCSVHRPVHLTGGIRLGVPLSRRVCASERFGRNHCVGTIECDGPSRGDTAGVFGRIADVDRVGHAPRRPRLGWSAVQPDLGAERAAPSGIIVLESRPDAAADDGAVTFQDDSTSLRRVGPHLEVNRARRPDRVAHVGPLPTRDRREDNPPRTGGSSDRRAHTSAAYRLDDERGVVDCLTGQRPLEQNVVVEQPEQRRVRRHS